ncbi:MAG: J domain-containing protein [Fimbriimonadales bacterium]|nr:J domain-containing protein [Fimbriimonadales bacterium]MDW8052490.1 J domain-containing protein [Armatimonadota bacterium]
MALGRRVTRLLRARLNELWERVEAILQEEEAEAAARQRAAEELSDALHQPQPTALPPTTAPTATPSVPPEVSRAYRVLGLPENADLAAVRRAYRELSARSDPNRFPEDSPEREKARQIQQRINQAYQTLLLHLDHSTQRFRNLSVE